MSERRARGLLDTSVVIDIEQVDEADLPHEGAVAAITMAELTAGSHAASDAQERAVRMQRLQQAEADFDQLPFDAAAARAYGRVYAAEVAAGRKARGPRALDLLIAATALSNGLALYTHNVEDFASLTKILDIVAVPVPGTS